MQAIQKEMYSPSPVVLQKDQGALLRQFFVQRCQRDQCSHGFSQLQKVDRPLSRLPHKGISPSLKVWPFCEEIPDNLSDDLTLK